MVPDRGEDELLARLDEEIALEEARPLGIVRQASGDLEREFASASADAAANLLEKALLRVSRGERAPARRFVERALALPYDDHNRVEPGPWGMHMMLFDEFSGQLEASEPNDSRWLDAIERLLAEISDEQVRHEVVICLPALEDFGPSAGEQQRLRRLVGRARGAGEPLAGIKDPERRIEILFGMLEALLRYRELVDEDDLE